jgi:hypothetical protein
MRGHVLLLLILILSPNFTWALCSNSGATVIYVNGILTKFVDAQNDLFKLQQKFFENGGARDIVFKNGYNPVHIDGYGDEIESVTQTLGSPISDYDLNTILGQIAPEVTTRKILLIGHSQGTFYTNEMYDYLVKNGVPTRSLGVYNIATPADHVEGNGRYLTSANDKLINQVRIWDAEAGVATALPANILIPVQSGDDADIYGGHHFQADYIAGAAPRIVSDIDKALNSLVADGPTDPSTCFVPPSPTITYDVQKAVLSVADPAAISVDTNSKTAAASIGSAIAATALVMAKANSVANDAIHSAVSAAFFSIFPKPDAQNAGTAFSVEKALYGSSLSEQDYEDLLGDDSAPGLGNLQTRPTPSQRQGAHASVQTQAQQSDQGDISPPEPSLEPVTQIASQLPSPVGVSPGFGGGGVTSAVISGNEVPSDVHVDTNNVEQAQGQNSQSAEGQDQQATSSDDADAQQVVAVIDQSSGNGSQSTSTPDTPTLPTTSPPDESSSAAQTENPLQASCGASIINAQGYFFDSHDSSEYSAQGYLIYHFKNISQYSDGRPFKLGWVFYDNNCNPEGPELNFDFKQFALPSGVTNWSVRFTSMTHFDVWDDQNGDIIASFDIPRLPLYSSIKFAGTIDGGGSTFDSRTVKINEMGAPPVFNSALPVPDPCQGISAQGYYFDPSYEHAEYIDGLLRVHLHLLTPYNDGRLFRSTVLAISANCSFDIPRYLSLPLETQITPFIQYYSFRMADPTHWVLWDDENDMQVQCSGCEGDIPEGTDYVSFYGSIDADATQLRTTPYPPTQM